jgi:anhydro-N-acetylmuramic acid kinase
MSGTSLDGVDVALVESDGERIARLGPAQTYPYSDSDRALLRQATADAGGITSRDERPGMLAAAEALVDERHAEAVEAFCRQAGEEPGGVDWVGFHGQTVLHDPARSLTVQIGDGSRLADRLGIPVVWDFRSADMAAGGQGAPLAPVFHRALARLAKLSAPIAFLNLGGVANVTFVGDDGTLVAFDTGPGNGLLDDFVRERRGAAYDADGALAASGTASQALVHAFLRHDYFAMGPPKSLDRHAFAYAGLAGLSDADGAATLLAISAEAVAASARHLPTPPSAWYASGGGRHNGALMRRLRERLAPAEVMPIEALGFDGDAVEAQAFGYLAIRAADGLPISFPTTTGVPAPLSGGRISVPGAAS